MKNIETQVSQIVNILPDCYQDALPSNIEKNPKEQLNGIQIEKKEVEKVKEKRKKVQPPSLETEEIEPIDILSLK